MTTPRRSCRIVFTTTIAAFLLAACSGGGAPPQEAAPAPARGTDASTGERHDGAAPDDPVALIRSVSQQVEEVGSFRMTFVMKIEAGGQTIAATGDGEFAQDPPAMHATYRFDELPGMPGGSEMEMILDGSTLYMRMPALRGSSGIPTEWISMDLEEVAPGFDDLVALSQGENDPTSSLAYLDGIVDAEVVGTENVVGVETTHYRGTVDPAAALERLSHDADADARAILARAKHLLGTTTMPVDVWIDGDDLLRRMSFRMEAAAGVPGGFAMEMTMEIPEYGVQVRLPIPAAKDVTDLSEVIGGGDY
jgi:hypothetical protein